MNRRKFLKLAGGMVAGAIVLPVMSHTASAEAVIEPEAELSLALDFLTEAPMGKMPHASFSGGKVMIHQGDQSWPLISDDYIAMIRASMPEEVS